MGKPSGKKKKPSGGAKTGDAKHAKPSSSDATKILDEDASVFVDMANELKDDGNRLFQRRDYERALLNYEKSIRLLPKAHPDVASLRSNLAACYMQMEPPDYYRAINECNFALEASPRYTKALLKRARCFMALGGLDLACRDVDKVLAAEPNNMTALDISERVVKTMEEKGIVLNEKAVLASAIPEVVPPVKEKSRKKKSLRKIAEKAVAAEKEEKVKEEEPPKSVKLVFGEDIRLAQVPGNCSVSQLREVVRSKFPGLKTLLHRRRQRGRWQQR